MKEELNKYEAMIKAIEEARKIGVNIKMSINKWGEWNVFALGQRFKDKDVTAAVVEAMKLILKVKR